MKDHEGMPTAIRLTSSLLRAILRAISPQVVAHNQEAVRLNLRHNERTNALSADRASARIDVCDCVFWKRPRTLRSQIRASLRAQYSEF